MDMVFDSETQLLKTRDDPQPVTLRVDDTDAEAGTSFTLADDSSCSWASADESFGPDKLRPRIEPWLTALVQSDHLSLLVGSGLTHAVHGMATDQKLAAMDMIDFDDFREEIGTEVKRSAKAMGREEGNFEDQIRAANELLRGLEIVAVTKAEDDGLQKKIEKLRDQLTGGLQSFAEQILGGEKALALSGEEQRREAFTYLVSFLMSFASRAGTRERLHLFTTNYDRYLEAGAEVAGLRLIDRFVGSLAPVFRASRLDIDLHYNPPGIRGEPRYLEGVARFTKLHGSVDWLDCEGSIRRLGLPFGAEKAEPYLALPGIADASPMQLMIYPNAAKDRETTAYPYVELFRDFAASICRPNNTLVCYGYSFGDDHINRVIKDMLTIPSTHLVMISYGDPLGKIMSTYKEVGRGAQITLLMGNHLGNLEALVDHYLPKPAIDRTTMRMAELLKARFAHVEDRRGSAETSDPSSASNGGPD